MSQETKDKIGRSNKGKKRSDENKIKMSIYRKGKDFSTKESRAKISKANTGRKHSELSKKKNV